VLRTDPAELAVNVPARLPAVLDLIRQAQDELTSTLAGTDERVDEQPGRTARGHDPQRHVEVTLTGGEPVDVRIERGWLRQAGSQELGRALTPALRDGYARQDDAGPGAVLRRGATAELTALAADPERLLRAVGLLPDRS
jgi:hypothetical protein